jgi:hypothetical protein
MEPAQGSLLGRRAISHTVVTDHRACVFPTRIGKEGQALTADRRRFEDEL